jgi:hypothetical protein
LTLCEQTASPDTIELSCARTGSQCRPAEGVRRFPVDDFGDAIEIATRERRECVIHIGADIDSAST